MVINRHAIQVVRASDVGRFVTYQCAGMDAPRHGQVRAQATTPGMVFVDFLNDNQPHGRLVDTYNLRWGHVDGWLKSSD